MSPNPNLPKTRAIIFEGPDGLGKSTAAKAVSDRLGWEIQHMTKPGPSFDYSSDYFRMNRLGRGPKILDRFHLGALVYGRMLRLHPQCVTEETLLYVMLRLRYEFNARTVLLISQSDEWYRDHIEKLSKEREEMFNVSQMVRANACYRRIAYESMPSGSHIARLPLADDIWWVDKWGFPNEKAIAAWTAYAN